MLITVTGRKSGRPIQTPVDYAEAGNTLFVTSRPDRKWWRNLTDRAPVSVLLRGRTVAGTAQAYGSCFACDEAAAEQEVRRALAVKPAWASRLGVGREKGGEFKLEDLERVAHERVVVEITLNEAGGIS